MIPAYGAAFGMPKEAFIGMAAAIWPAIDSMAEFALYCVVPFNLLKCILVSGITILIYKKLSPILKK
jgi:riboflavin transporter FmnP